MPEPARTDQFVLPVKRQRYRHPRLRGTWTVESCGAQWITLTSNLCLPKERIPTTGFLAAGWERVR